MEKINSSKNRKEILSEKSKFENNIDLSANSSVHTNIANNQLVKVKDIEKEKLASGEYSWEIIYPKIGKPFKKLTKNVNK